MEFFFIVWSLFFFVGLFVLLTNNPVHSILALVLIFFLSSCLALILGVEFLAFLILIVYVGAIAVLFLFVVMLLNMRVIELNASLLKYWWLGVLDSLFLLLNLFYSLYPTFYWDTSNDVVYTSLINQLSEWTSIGQFGELIFLYFTYLLFIAALVLFIAIVSPVMLSFVTFVKRDETPFLQRRQEIFLQVLRLSVDKNY